MENNGYANNVQRGFVAMGLFKDQQDVEMSPTQFGTVRPGDIKYRDIMVMARLLMMIKYLYLLIQGYHS